jgi:hypothetical protein
MDFMKGIGNFLQSGIQKVAGFVGKLAPAVQTIAGVIPTPLTQGIAQAANLAGTVANAVNGQPAEAVAEVPAAAAPAAQAAPAAAPAPVM